MKMNAIKFAELIGYIVRVCNGNVLDRYNIQEISNYIDEGVETQARPDGMLAADIIEMFRYMKEGKKIEAIKILRNSTNLGLKEAKAAIEIIYPIQPLSKSD